MKTYKSKKILLNIEAMPDGWLHLPDTERGLETEGVFSLDSRDFPPGSNEHIPKAARDNGWVETLDKSMIEDVIFNVDQQLASPALGDYFNAFVFYCKNDAFIIL